MSEPTDHPIELIQTERYHMMSFVCGIFKKMIQMNLFTKQTQT